METAAFDTLATARKLKAAGVEPAQAEAHAEAIASAMRDGALATRADLQALELRMTLRLGGPIVLATAFLAALVKLA